MDTSFSPSRKLAWVLWSIASIFYAYQYVLRVMPNIMMQDIMQQFGIGPAAFGQFSGVYYIGYSLMHIPVGILLDRIGPRKVMASCMLLTSIGLSPLLWSEHWTYPLFGRFLIGLGSSAAILGVFKIIRMTFDASRFSRLLSLSVTIGLIGAIYGGLPVHSLKEAFGSSTVLQGMAWAGAVLALITYWVIPEMKTSSTSTVLADIKEVACNKKVLACCIFAGLMVGPLEGFADVWGTAFLKEVYGLEESIAASLPSMIFIGMCFGGPLLNWISEKIKSSLLAIVGAGAFMSLSFSLLLSAHLRPAAITVNFLLVGMCCAYQILAIYKASTYVREQVAGLTTAIANMIIMFFGYAFHTVIGCMVNWMGGMSGLASLTYGVSIIPICLILGTGGFFYFFLQEKKQHKEIS